MSVIAPAIPTCSVGGRTPSRNVAAAIVRIDSRGTIVRPWRSPTALPITLLAEWLGPWSAYIAVFVWGFWDAAEYDGASLNLTCARDLTCVKRDSPQLTRPNDQTLKHLLGHIFLVYDDGGLINAASASWSRI